MKLKKLALLTIAALILGILAWRSLDAERRLAAPEAIGQPAFQGLDVNQVRKILVESSDSTVTVARVSGVWVVPSRYNYPANFSKIAQVLRDLNDAKIWQVMNVAETHLDEFNLLLPGHARDDHRESEGTLVTLLGQQDAVLSSFVIGKNFARKPDPVHGGAGMMLSSGQDGQYVRLSDGRIVVLSTFLGRLLESVEHWLADDFINVSAGQLAEMTVAGQGRAEIKIKRDTELARLALQGLADDEEADASKFNQLTGMFGYLSFHDVADPDLTPAKAGMDKPVTVTAVTTQGVVYALSIGAQVSTNNPDRYVSLQVSLCQSDVTPAAAEQSVAEDQTDASAAAKDISGTVAEQQRRFSPWIYIVKSYRVEAALTAREDLVVKKEEPADEPSAGDGDATTADDLKPAQPAAPDKATE